MRISVRPWFNPTLRSSVYIVPGIIGVLLSMTMVVITSVAVVRERERGVSAAGDERAAPGARAVERRADRVDG